MFDLETLKANLIAKGYEVSCFDTAADAASYLETTNGPSPQVISSELALT